MTGGILPGPYRVPAYRASGHFRLTNKTPAATYRAPGRFETTFVRERLIDAVAARLRHGCKRGAPPQRHRGRTRCPITGRSRRWARRSSTIPAITSASSTSFLQRSNGRSSKRSSRAAGPRARRSARALRCSWRRAGLARPTACASRSTPPARWSCITGGASIGQGFETVMAQVCGEMLGVDYRHVRVTHGQTDRIAFGIGAHASRATVMTASATHNAAVKLRAKALDMAAELMQTPADALDIVDGKVVRKDAPAGPSMTLGEIADHLEPDLEDARRARARALVRGLVPRAAPSLSLWDSFRGGQRRSRDRRRCRRALCHRL